MKTSYIAATLLVASLITQALAEPELSVRPSTAPTFSELPTAIPLWPGRAPGTTGEATAPKMHWESFGKMWAPVMDSVEVPAILPFLPDPSRATGAAIVVIPGGGHHYLAMSHEGYAVGRWLADHGIAAFVLEYRLARSPGSTYSVETHSLMDTQRAIRTVRARAAQWKVKPSAIGVMGFSAGGELAYLAADRAGPPVPGSHDAIDAVDCRPDFQCLFYPGLSESETEVSPQSPPAFLCSASNDKLTPGMVRLYLALEADGIPADLHVFSRGGHGFGIREEKISAYAWMGLLTSWLQTEGFIAGAAPATQ
jgi:acetyl esterase/lipase